MENIILGVMDNSDGFFERVRSIVNDALAVSDSEEVNKMIQYQTSMSGHMIRPFLTYISAMAASGGHRENLAGKLKYFAAAIELLHNASLMHDDVLDGELTRRGAECFYRVYGTKNAILAGNIHYIKAIELAGAYFGSSFSLRILGAASDMCLGEILQNSYEGRRLPDAVYFEIIERKTAALTALACSGAAEIAGASEREIRNFGELGRLIGIIYQLQDDYRDQDTLLREDFNFSGTLEDCLEKVDAILQELPQAEYIGVFKAFTAELASTAGG